MVGARKMAAGERCCTSVLFLVGIVAFYLVPCAVEAGLTLSKVCGEVSCQEHEFCSEYEHRCQRCDSVCEKSSHNFQEDVCHKDCQDYLHDRRYVRTDGEATVADVEGLKSAVDRLTQLAAASIAISAILLLLFSAFACLVWGRSRRAPGGDGGEAANRSQEDRDVASYLHTKISSVKNPFKGNKNATAAVSNTANGLKLDIAAAVPSVAQQQTNSRQTPQPQAPPPPERTPASPPGTAGGRSEGTDAYSPPTTTSTPLSNRPPRYPSEDTTLDYAYDNRALTPSPRFDKGNGLVPHPPTPYHTTSQQMGLGIKGETTF